jgi:hypothetical protein
MTSYTLKLNFSAENGKSTAISLPGVRNDLTNNEVKNLMQQFINSGVVVTSAGKVAAKKKGVLYAVEVTPYTLTA